MAQKKTKKRTAPKTSGKSSAKHQTVSLLTLFPEYRRTPYTEKVKSQNTQFRDELREAYLHRGLVLYLGAGVSRSLGLPSWPELIRSLTVTMMTRKVESAIQTLGATVDEKYWTALQKILAEIKESADYEKPILMMARAIKDEMGTHLAYLIVRTLYRGDFHFWARSQMKKRVAPRIRRALPSSELLDELVALSRAERDTRGVQAIVNYNYDDVFDEKLREQNVRCVTVLSGRDKVPTGALPCYHVHGVLPLRMMIHSDAYSKKATLGNFVFSEDEYHAEYSDPYRWSNMTQIGQLGRYTGLFVGLSMQDPNIRRLIDVTHQQYPEVKNYAVMPRKASLSETKDSKNCVLRNLFEEVESRSFEKIGVNVIWVDSYPGVAEFVRSIHHMDAS